MTAGQHYLKHNRGGGVWMNGEHADALQRPLECHLILPLLPSCKQLSVSVTRLLGDTSGNVIILFDCRRRRKTQVEAAAPQQAK